MISPASRFSIPGTRYLGKNIYHFHSLHSSNLELLSDNNALYTSGDIVLADEQSAGIGRYKRHWVSHFGGLYFSILFEDVENLTTFYPFVILCALAVRDRIADLSASRREICLKWPNDVYADGRKISGILVQSRNTGELSRVVIGIGINLNNEIPRDRELRNPAVNLAELSGQPVDISSFFSGLILTIDSFYHDFIQGKFPDFLPRLNQHIYGKNSFFKFTAGNRVLRVRALEYTKLGHLLAEDDKGKTLSLSIGELC